MPFCVMPRHLGQGELKAPGDHSSRSIRVALGREPPCGHLGQERGLQRSLTAARHHPKPWSAARHAPRFLSQVRGQGRGRHVEGRQTGDCCGAGGAYGRPGAGRARLGFKGRRYRWARGERDGCGWVRGGRGRGEGLRPTVGVFRASCLMSRVGDEADASDPVVLGR